MRRRRPLPAGALLLLAACAPTLTPQQEWVMSNFESCRTETKGWNAHLDRVEPDGRFHVTAAQTQTDASLVVECMRQRVQPPPPKAR